RRAALLTAVLLCAAPSQTAAHDIPASVIVQAFIKPEGQQLRVVLRVPLQSMRDIDIPQRGPGYLDLVAIRPELANAAQLWIAEYLEIFEGDRKLASPRITATRISLPSDRSLESYARAVSNVLGPPLT